MSDDFYINMEHIEPELKQIVKTANKKSLGQVAIGFGMFAISYAIVEVSKNLIRMAERFRS